MQEPKSPRTGCASRGFFGMQVPTPPQGRDEQGYSAVVLGSRSWLGSDRLARTGLAVADADVRSVPCLVPHPAVPALPALSETCAMHSQDFSMAPSSCFPFLMPPKSADLLMAAKGLNSCKAGGNPRFNAGDTPKPPLPRLAKSLCYFCIRQEYPQGGRRRKGTSCKWESPGLVPRAWMSRGWGLGWWFPYVHTLCLCLSR